MDLSFRDDPDSGHPSSRLEFNPSEMATSTPIPPSRQSRLRSHSSSFRPTSPTGVDYRTVDGVIQVVKENRQLREENDELRNQSMTSNHELNESRAKVSELEAQVKTFTFQLPTIDVRSGKVEPPSNQLIEEKKQLEDEKEEMEKKLREKEEELDGERKKATELQAKCAKLESEREQILERTMVTIKLTEEKAKEKEEEMKGEWKKKEEMMEEEKREMEKEMEGLKEEMRSKDGQLVDERTLLREKEGLVDELMEEKKKTDEMKKKNEEMGKEMESLREKILEMEIELNGISTEGERILSLEKQIKELEKKCTVAEEELINANNRFEELKTFREGEMKEILAAKTKVHEQRTTIDNLNRVNGELEEKKREGVRLKEQLNEKAEEVKKITNEMDQLKADVAKRREVQKRLEDELDIARKLSKDAADEVHRMSEEREKEKEEGRMEWMSKELRDNEELKKTMDREREESLQEKRLIEMMADRDRFYRLYEDSQQQLHLYHANAEHRYLTDLASKEEEIHAMRERLAEFENYPGRLVSVDGRYSEGRSVYDLFPSQLKDFVDRTTNESVRRAVDCCKSMVIRGPIDNREERRKEAPPTLAYLPILIERLEEIEMNSMRSKTYLAFIVRMFKKMDGEEGTEELISSLASNIEEEMAHLDSEWKEMEKRNKKNEDNVERLRRSMEEDGERLRRIGEENRRLEEGIRKSEEERRKMEEEAIRADEGRKKAMNDLIILRAEMRKLKDNNKENEDAAHGFKELYETRHAELNDAEDRVEQLEERCQELTSLVNEKDRKIDYYVKEIRENHKTLEEYIAKNSEQSKKSVEDHNALQKQEKETRSALREVDRLTKERDHQMRSKMKLQACVRECGDEVMKHYRVYTRVRDRNERRQILLDHCLKDVDEIIRSIGKKGKLENLKDVRDKLVKVDEKIRLEITDYLVADAMDYKECKAIQSKIAAIEAEAEKENK